MIGSTRWLDCVAAHQASFPIGDEERAEGVDHERGARRHDRRGGLLVDDGRARRRGAGREIGARSSDRGRRARAPKTAAAAAALPLPRDDVGRRRRGAAEVAERRRADDHELDGRAGVRVAVAGLVRVVEALLEAVEEASALRVVGAVEGIVSVYSWPP